jgi:hypothetical protein
MNRLQEVRHCLRSRPQYLPEVCWKERDEWKVFADFLGNPLPDIPFPHA